MMKCDPIARAQCPHGTYCEAFAVYTDESECAKFNKYVLNQPITNSDRIRVMNDRELADFLSAKFADLQIQNAFTEDSPPTATQISALKHTWYVAWMQWLQSPVEG